MRMTLALSLLLASGVVLADQAPKPLAEVTSAAHAKVPDIPAGTVAECIPFPTMKAILSGAVFRSTEPPLVHVMTCDVVNWDPVPKRYRFVGEVRARSALGPYSIVWQRLQLLSADGVLELRLHDEGSMTSRSLDNGNLQVTFRQALKSGQH